MMKNTNNSLGHVSEIQIQHFQSKIESIKLYFNDLEHYFNNNKDEFVSQSNTESNIYVRQIEDSVARLILTEV